MTEPTKDQLGDTGARPVSSDDVPASIDGTREEDQRIDYRNAALHSSFRFDSNISVHFRPHQKYDNNHLAVITPGSALTALHSVALKGVQAVKLKAVLPALNSEHVSQDQIDSLEIFDKIRYYNSNETDDCDNTIDQERAALDKYFKNLVSDPEVRKNIAAHLIGFLESRGWSRPADQFNDVANVSLALPEVAPELYKDRNRGEGIIDFLRRVWQPWIDQRLLTRPVLYRLDRSAYQALANWLRTHELPDDLPIPTRSTIYDGLVADEAKMIEARRTLRAWERRQR